MNALRVATIIHGYYPRVGGAETQLRSLIPNLLGRGIHIQVLTRRYDPKLPAREIIDGVNVYRLPAFGPKVVASLVFTLAALLRLFRLRPQLVHAHEFISPATVALLAGRWLKIPIVITPHRSGAIGDVQKMERKAFGAMRLNALRKQTSRFIVISHEIQEELTRIGVPPDRLVNITNGVDIDRFTPPTPDQKAALRAQAGFSPDALLAIFTGRLVPEKRLALLISIWPAIQHSFPHAELIIVGTGPEEARLRSMKGKGIHFMGSTSDVVPYLQTADVFVLPSVAEGLSVALLEAMSCGLTPLITDVGGAREVVAHGKNGWLISPDDGESLVAGFQELFSNKQKLHEMGQAARQQITAKFSIQIAAEKLHDLYFQVVGAKQ